MRAGKQQIPRKILRSTVWRNGIHLPRKRNVPVVSHGMRQWYGYQDSSFEQLSQRAAANRTSIAAILNSVVDMAGSTGYIHHWGGADILFGWSRINSFVGKVESSEDVEIRSAPALSAIQPSSPNSRQPHPPASQIHAYCKSIERIRALPAAQRLVTLFLTSLITLFALPHSATPSTASTEYLGLSPYRPPNPKFFSEGEEAV